MPRRVVNRIVTFFNLATRRHLEWVFRITTTRPLSALGAFVAAMLVSAALIATIRFETDIFQLFPSRQPALKLLLDSLEWTGGSREAYFLLEGERTTLPQAAARFEERLRQARIDGQPAFTRVTWRTFDESQAASFNAFIAFAAANPRLFLAPDDLPRFVERFSPGGITAALTRLQSGLAGQFGGTMTGLAMADPLSVRDLILPRLKAASQSLDLDPASPYFMSRDGQVLIMIAEPAKPVQDMVFARKLVAAVNQARRTTAGVAISCAGAHMSAVMDEAAMKSNVLISVVSSLFVVLGIFYAAYRRILPTLLIPLILGGGVVLALGTAGLFLRSIHIISFAFTALITGIGTDYSIHLYDRFHTERAMGKGTEEALQLAFLNTGHGVFTAAITTALPFLALCISDVRALSELGLLVGLGVIYSLYTSLLFLPSLLIYMEKRHPMTYRPIPHLGLRPVWRCTQRFPASVLCVTMLVVAGLCWSATGITFDGELKNLQPRHSEAFLAQERMERHLSLAPKQMLVALEGHDLGDVLSRLGRVESLVAALQGRGEIVAWSSLGRIVNAPQQQHEIASGLAAAFKDGVPVTDLRSGLERAGFEITPFQPFLSSLAGLMQPAVPGMDQALARLAASPFKGVLDRHLIKDTQGYHALVYLHYRPTEFKSAAFLATLKDIDPTARATSLDMVADQLTGTVRASFVQAFLLGGVLVLLMLLIHFVETPTGLAYSLFPVAAATGCMLGSMALLGMGLNYMNVMVLVTIVGMGSDFGLYVRFRVIADTPDEREAQYVQTARSALLSALTTVVGFGSLAFTDYGAMSSIGWATNLGVGFTTLFALVTLAALLAMSQGKRV